MKSKSILDPTFRYTNSASTDIRKTFARARRQLRQERATPAPQSHPVIQLRRIA